MLNLKRKAKIAIFTTGYWRSYFLRQLFANWAKIDLFDIRKVHALPKEGAADYILWEKQLPFGPYDNLDENKIFIYDYKDEGDRDTLIETAHQWNLPNPRFLLLFPNRNSSDTGCLPLPPPSRLTKSYILRPKKLKERKYDTFFMCSPTFIHVSSSEWPRKKNILYSKKISDRNEFVYNQRVEWVLKLKQAGLLRSDNGLIRSDKDYLCQKAISLEFNFKDDVFVQSISKKEFTNNLLNSKIVFSPGGHSRWTYRHIESMFNRALTVSVDMSKTKSIPELPLSALVMVPDGEFDPTEIKKILKDIDCFQEKADIGYQFAKSTYKQRTILHRETFRKKEIKKMFHSFLGWIDKNTHR